MSQKTYPQSFKDESASLVLDQNYSIKQACDATGVGTTAMRRWVKQLESERNGHTPEKAQAISQEHQQIQQLQAQIKRLEREKAILKKATALLMSEGNSW